MCNRQVTKYKCRVCNIVYKIVKGEVQKCTVKETMGYCDGTHIEQKSKVKGRCEEHKPQASS